MVSSSKIKFFKERLDEIKRVKLDSIAAKYPEIKTDYQSLIFQGKGTLLPESQIREIVGDLRSSCPLVVDVSRLFSFKKEREEAIKANDARADQYNKERTAFLKQCKAALDLVYFGKDEQLKAALEGLEAFEVKR